MEIRWRNSLALGVPAIDRQHQQIFSLINELNAASGQGKGAAMVDRLLDELVLYVSSHFELEEACFRQAAYPEADAHAREHREMIRKVNAIVGKFKSTPHADREALAKELQVFLNDWWQQHILTSDILFAKFARAQGLSLSG